MVRTGIARCLDAASCDRSCHNCQAKGVEVSLPLMNLFPQPKNVVVTAPKPELAKQQHKSGKLANCGQLAHCGHAPLAHCGHAPLAHCGHVP